MTNIFGIGIEVNLICIILSIPIYFVCSWFYKKIIKDILVSKIFTWVSTIILTPITYYYSILLFFTILFYSPNNAFDKLIWNSDKEKRYELSQDIIESQLLIGKSKHEVIEILGIDSNCEENDVWSFYLGFKPGLGIDPDMLQITFKEGKVIKVEQYEG
jgi:hypothetical protein